MDTPTYGLIGRGRLAGHLARYLELEDRRVVRWHRGRSESAAEGLADADILLLAISDDALEDFVDSAGWSRGRLLVHFSGSLVISGAHGLHPLMTFGTEPYDLETYRSIPFVAERGGAGFEQVFPALRNPCWVIDPSLKPLYHALCVLSGNFTTLLWGKAMDDFESRLGLPREILRPFLERTAANTLSGGRSELTGSLARGESGTIARDLAGLTGDPFRDVYLAVAETVARAEATS
jgi:predicted short-subunit dehydrogenase-like oxidoreductase (DUF2520 family)